MHPLRGPTRRAFLQGTATSVAAIAAAKASLPGVALGAGNEGGPRDTFVQVYLRGAMDGLTLCVPYADAALYAARPTLAIAPPGQPGGAIALDGFFGLAPSAAPLLAPFQAGQLAFVHASGSTDPSRSHFDAQKFMELGNPAQPSSTLTTGWLGRHLQTSSPAGGGLLRGIALEEMMPRTLAGAPKTLPLVDPDGFVMPGDASTASSRRAYLQGTYSAGGPPLATSALDTFATIDLLAQIDFAGYVPANGAVYPTDEFGEKLEAAAALIKADIGVEALAIDFDGWDLHAEMGPHSGAMAQKLDVLARGLNAFWRDLGTTMSRVTLVAISEFGRRVAENGSHGTDHGHGNCMLVLGGHVAGGQVIRQWPGLAPAQLDQGDLAVTIDYRDVLSEILWYRLGCTRLSTVFPGYTPVFRGVTA